MAALSASMAALMTERTMLVLAAAPGDESLACGGLVAEACARGRPPLVAVLTDGSSLGPPDLSEDERAARHERETRAAVRALGLPPNRLLMSGVKDAAVPGEGWFFDQIVEALGFLTWMRDLNLVCGPRAEDARTIQGRAGAIAADIAGRIGLPLLTYGAGHGAACVVHRHAVAKAHAVAAHGLLAVTPGDAGEWFEIWHGG